MAVKRTYKKPKNTLTFFGVLKGNFLYREEVKANYKYFLLVFGLIMIVIYANNKVSEKIGRINELKTQVEEYKSQNAYAQSRLINIKLESELSRQVIKDSLRALEHHPLKILVKIDSTKNDETK